MGAGTTDDWGADVAAGCDVRVIVGLGVGFGVDVGLGEGEATGVGCGVGGSVGDGCGVGVGVGVAGGGGGGGTGVEVDPGVGEGGGGGVCFLAGIKNATALVPFPGDELPPPIVGDPLVCALIGWNADARNSTTRPAMPTA